MKIKVTNSFFKGLQFSRQNETSTILADPLKIRGQIQLIHLMGVNDPKLDGEKEEEMFGQIALPFPRLNYLEMIRDLIMISCLLKCIVQPVFCKLKNSILYLLGPWKELMEKLIIRILKCIVRR